MNALLCYLFLLTEAAELLLAESLCLEQRYCNLSLIFFEEINGSGFKGVAVDVV